MSSSLRQMWTDLGTGRQTRTQTGQIVDETHSKPQISPGFAVLLDIKAPRFASSSLDATTEQRQEGVGLQSILPKQYCFCQLASFGLLFSKTKASERKNHVKIIEEKMKP